MIELIILIISFIALIKVVRTLGILSPTSIVCSMTLTNMVVFYFVELVKVNASRELILSHSYKFNYSYISVAAESLIVYFIFFLGLASVALRVQKIEGRNKYFNNLKIDINSRYLFVCSAFLVAICLAHIMITELKFIATYYSYLEIRNPDFYNATNIISKLVIANIGFVGVTSAPLLAISIINKKKLLTTVLVLVFLYTSVFQAAAHSRWLVLQMATLLFLLLTSKKSKTSKLLITFLTAALPFAYFSTIFARTNASFGLNTVFNSFSLSDLTEIALINSLANLFGGMLVLSETLNKASIWHPDIFKSLSFSPLPSFIDNFSSVRDSYEIRINIYGPLSAISEAYWFGISWSALFLFIVVQSLKCVESIWQMSKKTLSPNTQLIAFLAFGLTLYAHVLIHQYPIRSSLRWVWLAWIMHPIFYYNLSRRSIRSAK